jgi:hypothetical protein
VVADEVRAEPAAIVEEIIAAKPSLGIMDYVEPGDSIALKTDERLVLGYFRSCVQETIVGGTVTIGASESAVVGGTVTRRKVQCDGGGVRLTDKQAKTSGVVAFRAGAPAASKAPAQPEIKLYGLSPILHTTAAGKVTIIRVDKPATIVEVIARAGATDLAKRDIALEPGAVYRAEFVSGQETRSVVFATDAFAEPGSRAMISRLLRL